MLLTTLRLTTVRTLVLFAALGIAFGTGSSVRADTVVVPNSLATAEGNSNNRFPFGIMAAPPTQRYQQVYAASQFSPGSGPLLITQILFRPDAISGDAFTATLPDIQINLSTTTPGPDGLSATFASNVGANDTIVRSRGALTLSSADTPGPGGTRNFDIVINLTTPFLYDPTQGNLLMDVRNFGGGTTTFFDAHDVLGDSISRVYTFNGTVTSAIGDQVNTSGLVTAFTFTRQGPPTGVPEPATMVLLGIGLAGLAGAVRRHRKADKG
jgi:hypothetical protein